MKKKKKKKTEVKYKYIDLFPQISGPDKPRGQYGHFRCKTGHRRDKMQLMVMHLHIESVDHLQSHFRYIILSDDSYDSYDSDDAGPQIYSIECKPSSRARKPSHHHLTDRSERVIFMDIRTTYRALTTLLQQVDVSQWP